jgi:hypothetical protein
LLDPQTENFILPLDWDGTSTKSASTTHLQEWQRFAASLGATLAKPLNASLEEWKVIQPAEHS